MGQYLVVGSSSGIGYSLCEKLLRDNHNVVGLAQHSPAFASLSSEKMTRYNHVSVDLRRAGGAEFREKLLPEIFGTSLSKSKIHVCLCAAMHGKDFAQANEDLGIDIFNVNLLSYYRLMRELDSYLACGSRICFVGSTLSHVGIADQPAYCASKHGLQGLMKSLALLWAGRGINVNGVDFGLVDTPMFKKRLEDVKMSAEEFSQAVPQRRIASASEAADLLYKVLSDDLFKGFTGQSLIYDGGQLAGFSF